MLLTKISKFIMYYFFILKLFRPLEDHVSKWEVVIEAKDSGNLTVNNTLELVVQQLPHLRAINHQLTLQMRLKQDSLAWIHPVSWSLDIIDRISTIYSTEVKDITVLDWPRVSILAANKDKHSIQFTWTNDTLPREVCPKEQITQILGVCLLWLIFQWFI